MALTDPIADMLTRIRNACMVKFESVDVPSSRMKKEISRILKEEGYIKGSKIIDDQKQGVIRIYLRYDNTNRPVITNLKRISKPGRRVYVKKDKVPRVSGGMGIAILSTSKGIMTDKNTRQANLGGEVLCYVW
ncbi:MAG: 30S ribosomal protein S8 [Thermoplasmata archaeon]|nr:MAG: 30S ribosomal protein S8 [Thermoplasmata archaeon]